MILPTGDFSPMEVLSVKWTALTWLAGELLPSHLIILSDFSIGPVMCVILAIWHFQEPPRAATTLRNSLVLLKLPDGFVFSSLAVKRYVFLFRFKARGSCYLWC